jgi:DNA polymerase-3 subunit beta
MKLSLAKTELQRGLGRLQAIVEKRNSMPILAHALLVASKDPERLEIAATDLEVGIRGVHDAEVSKAGSVTVAARKLFEIVRELPDGTVQLSVGANSYLEVECARSRFSLAGTSADEFPTLPELVPGRMARLQAAVLSTMIERTLYAASTDETRYNLNGVLIELPEAGDRVRMVATDGHRLAVVDRTVGAETERLATGVIVPRKALAELKRLVDEEEADEVELGFEGNSALARRGGVSLAMRLIEGEFPNYRQVMPKTPRHRLVLASEPLGQALRRVALLSAERSRTVRLEFGDGRLTVSTSNPELGEAREELDVDYGAEAIAIGFNARYLLDALAAFRSKEVEFALDDQLSPALIRPTDDPDSVAVVMPMRL